MQSGRPAIYVFVFPSSSFLSLVAIQWVFGPSVVISPGYMPCPSPFGFFYFLNDVFDFGFISYFGISDFIAQCDI